MNENEMSFQYLEHLEVEFLNSNFKLKEAVLSVKVEFLNFQYSGLEMRQCTSILITV